jgi:DNA/RNA non-specific endonuclease
LFVALRCRLNPLCEYDLDMPKRVTTGLTIASPTNSRPASAGAPTALPAKEAAAKATGWKPAAGAAAKSGLEKPSIFSSTTESKVSGKPVDIATLASKAGWNETSWQTRFLREADASDKGSRGQGKAGDGLMTAAEVRDYAYHPAGAKFLTSLALEQVAQATGTEHQTHAYAEPWMNDVAKQAAQLAGRHDGKVSGDQMRAYAKHVSSGVDGNAAQWVTNQRVQVLFHQIARFTGERDALDSPNKMNATEMVFPAMALAFDPKSGIAVTASNTYFAADEKLSSQTERSDKFYSAGLGVDPKVFIGPKADGHRSFFEFKGLGHRGHESFDKGHLLANLNFNDPRDRNQSFATENMHAQVAASNSGVWLHKVEMAVRNEVVAINGRAVDVSGVLFSDQNFKPLSPDKIPWIAGAAGAGSKGSLPEGQRVPVPTHTWKAVLFQSGDTPPKYQVKCYIVENRMDLNRASDPKIVSLVEMERILGGKVKLFQDLPPKIRKAIENSPVDMLSSADQFITDNDAKLPADLLGTSESQLA